MHFNSELLTQSLNQIQIFYNQNYKNIDLHYDHDYAFIYACSIGQLDLIQWLWKTSKYEVENNKLNARLIDIHVDREFPFQMICEGGLCCSGRMECTLLSDCDDKCVESGPGLKCGHLESAIWLINLSYKIKSPINIDSQLDHFLYICAENGNVGVMKWLIERSIINGKSIDLHFGDDDYHTDALICIACESGQLEIMKLLYNIIKDLDLNLDNNFLFRNSCENGYVDIVKWLLENSKNPINIRMMNEYPFRISCKNGYLELAKLLYQLGIDNNDPINITAKHHYAFIRSSENNHIETAKWLTSLCSIYHLSIDDDEIIDYHISK